MYSRDVVIIDVCIRYCICIYVKSFFKGDLQIVFWQDESEQQLLFFNLKLFWKIFGQSG